MMIEELFHQIPKKLASFTNDELYFIIAELLLHQNLEKKFIVERSLYIKTSSNLVGEQLTFLLIDKLSDLSSHQQNYSCFISVGQLDAAFTNIHLHSISFAETKMNNEFDIATIKVLLSGLVEPTVYRPTYLIDGLLSIIKQPHFEDRTENILFKFNMLDNPYCHYFDLGTKNDIDYSGMYYCIAETDRQAEQPSTLIHHFNLEGEENYQPTLVHKLTKRNFTLSNKALGVFN